MASILAAKNKTPLSGSVLVPGDKSMSHRALMLASVAKGTSSIHGLLASDDVFATAQALKQVGVVFSFDRGSWIVTPPAYFESPDEMIDVGNSGTSARLLMGLLCGRGIDLRLTGDASLCRRPMRRAADPLRLMGAKIDLIDDKLPAQIHSVAELSAIDYAPPVASAQVKSALLLASLCAKGSTVIVEKTATRDHTEHMLRYMGARIVSEAIDTYARRITFDGYQQIIGSQLNIPGDPSSAAFLLAAAAMIPGSDVTLKNVMINPYRNGFIDCLKDMGADIAFESVATACGEDVANIRLRYAPLSAISVPAYRVPSMIDEVPIFAVLAATLHGQTRIPNLSELRFKESDRLQSMANGLSACGVAVDILGDDLLIKGVAYVPGGGVISASLDHRIAMSFAILGLAAQEPVFVSGAETISSSFPQFFTTMQRLGADLRLMSESEPIRTGRHAGQGADFADAFFRR